jgi:hypothetical protein
MYAILVLAVPGDPMNQRIKISKTKVAVTFRTPLPQSVHQYLDKTAMQPPAAQIPETVIKRYFHH